MSAYRAMLVVVGVLALAHSTAAETSSWVMESTEAPKPKRGKPVKARARARGRQGVDLQGVVDARASAPTPSR